MTTTIIALAILLVPIPCTRLVGLVPAWKDLEREIQCSSLKVVRQHFWWPWLLWMKYCLVLEVLILKKEIRGRDCSTGRAKIYNHKIVNKWNLCCISKNLGTVFNICYRWTSVKSSDSVSILRGWILTWKSQSLTLKVGSSGLKAQFGRLFSYLWTIRCFLLVERGGLYLNVWSFRGLRAHFCACFLLLESFDVSFSLKGNVLTCSVDLRGRGHVYVLRLFTRDLQFSFFSFRRECLDLKGLSLREKSLIWGRVLMEDLIVLVGDLGGRETLVEDLVVFEGGLEWEG